MFEDENGLILVDYKTDGITDRFKGGFEEAKPILEKRYKVQIDLYTKAIEQIYKRPVVERLFIFLRWCPSFKIGKIINTEKTVRVIHIYPTVFLIISNVWLVD